jgi:predicted aminopeptidase
MFNFRLFLVILTAVFCSACSDFGYYLSAGLNQLSILNSREDLETVLSKANAKHDQELADKIKLIQDARSYASKLGLSVGGTFDSIAQLKNEKKIWVLMATEPNSMRLHYWSYPIVGRAPYKGFFEKELVLSTQAEFDQKKYITNIRQTVAFSSLGWFDDPLLPSLLKLDRLILTNTIFHELIHKQIWIKNRVALNESLASFLGYEINVSFYRARLKTLLDQQAERLTADNSSSAQLTQARLDYRQALEQRTRMFANAKRMRVLYGRLTRLNRAIRLSQSARLERSHIFERLKLPSGANNAEIMQQKIYLTAISSLAACSKKYQQLPKLFAFIERMFKVTPQVSLSKLRRCSIGLDHK